MGQIVLENCVKLGHPRSNHSREIPRLKQSEAVFSTDFFRYNFLPEVCNNVISGVAIDHVGVDVHVIFGDSYSNNSRGIRGADFVSNERT